MPEVRDWQAHFDTVFRDMAGSVHDRVWREVYGDEYPEGIPGYNYVSRTELRHILRELRLRPGDVLGDFGCGQGGPGLWLAARAGTRLVGLDISAVALDAAKATAAALGLAERAEFRLGGFAGSPVDDGALDAVVSIEALLFAVDKPVAIAELARVLRPGGRLVATTFDYHSQPAGRPPQVDDHRPLLSAAGFDVIRYDETDQWRRRVAAIARRLLAATDEIAAETGEDPDELRADTLEMQATIAHMRRRVIMVAQRQ